MGGGKRNRSKKDGSCWTRSHLHNKRVMGFFRPRKVTAMWIPAIPSWEKEFCKQSVSLSWKEFCERKKYTCSFPQIGKWDDSAAEEAFQKTKRRYFAKINGTPCDIPEADPDAYIDVIDWNSPDTGDVDWPDEYTSDSENEENWYNESHMMENLPNLYQHMTISGNERYEKIKSEWKERPFGYGQIYCPEIHETRTVICMVVDLYTAQPPLLHHLKVDLWSEMSMLHAAQNDFGVSGWGSEFENEKDVICY